MITTVYQYINLDYLELMTDGDDDMKTVMLDMLFEELPTEIEKMNKTLDTKDWEELRQVSHKMKSTLAFVGNEQTTEANKQIESIAKANEGFEQLPELLKVMNTFLPKIMEELKKEYNRINQ